MAEQGSSPGVRFSIQCEIPNTRLCYASLSPRDFVKNAHSGSVGLGCGLKFSISDKLPHSVLIDNHGRDVIIPIL